jgi:hypothetical protein
MNCLINISGVFGATENNGAKLKMFRFGIPIPKFEIKTFGRDLGFVNPAGSRSRRALLFSDQILRYLLDMLNMQSYAKFNKLKSDIGNPWLCGTAANFASALSPLYRTTLFNNSKDSFRIVRSRYYANLIF